jgi:hypothetical protein
MMRTKLGAIVLALSLVPVGIVVEAIAPQGPLTQTAQAYPPNSAGGAARRTARRTSRRVVRRSNYYYNSLPSNNCTIVIIDGIQVYQCGRDYYQRYNNQYVIVYVD